MSLRNILLSNFVGRAIIEDAADSFGGKEVLAVTDLVVMFLISVVAGVVANYISKRWDGDRRL